ncbi:MAG: cyclodeaminase/cyclohydrolase family protein [Bacillota bacterium]
MQTDKTIYHYLQDVSAKTPVAPSAGSVLALCAASSAALTEFVANTTIGKKGYEDAGQEMKEISQTAQEYRQLLLTCMEEDTEAMNGVFSAFKLPKDTPEAKMLRDKEIQKAYQKSVLSPLKLLKETYNLMELIYYVMKEGNINAFGDAVTAANLAEAVIISSVYNMKINLESIKDDGFKEGVLQQLEELEDKTLVLEEQIMLLINN